ncbi:MAG: tRNA threonylcarbamoyladenosine dehydratase [Clostridia bacterium]|nr:tRNA threonylcarbamoyladenosine dehydratase [Clostridia bacterium]
MKEQFEREAMLIGEDGVARLQAASVAVFGVGGVGSFTVEALARAGVGRLLLVDNDTVSVTNLNRQLIALHSTVGRLKAEVAAERVRDINPDCAVEVRAMFYTPDTADTLDLSSYDYIVDAVDTVSAKLELIVRAKALGIPVISCMGAGNKRDATRFEVADVFDTSVCPLARVMRRELRARGVTACKVVYSKEEPVKAADGSRLPGSLSYVPSVAGLIAAGEVIRDLTEGQ